MMENESQTKSEPSQEPELEHPGEGQSLSSESRLERPEDTPIGPGIAQDQPGVSSAEDELEMIVAKQSSELSKTVSMLKETISGRSEAEKLARASQERFGQLCEITNDLVYIHNLSGKLTSFNPAAEKITGYTREEAVQMNIADLIAPAYRELILLMVDPQRADEAPTHYHLEFLAKDGRSIPLRVIPRFIYWGGNPVGILGAASPSQEGESARGTLRHPSAELVVRLEEETAQLSRANAMLREQIAGRERAEDLLRKRTAELEKLQEERVAELFRTGHSLEEETAARERAETALREALEGFEARLEERNGELSRINASLKDEIAARERAEDVLWKTTADLEVRHEELNTELARTQDLLREESARREQAEEALKKSSMEFEARLVELTGELSKANAVLREQISQHEQNEGGLRRIVAELEAHLKDKSAELAKAGELVREEISRRGSVEEELGKAKAEFEMQAEERVALAKADGQLNEEICRREGAEANLKKAIEELERRLEEGSAELLSVNETLKDQLVEQELAQETLRKTIADLQKQLDERNEELSKVKAILQEEVAALESAEEALDKAEEVAPALHETAPQGRELMLLGDMGNLLRACTTLDEAYRVMSRAAPQLFSNLVGALYVISPSRNLLGPVAYWGRMVPDERTFSPADCWSLRTSRVHWVEDSRTGLVCRHLQSPLPDSYVCVPMLACGEILGMLYLSQSKRGEITIATIRLAATVAEYVAMAMSHLKQAGSLSGQAVCDPLTGLFNRRFMEDALELEVHRCAQNQSALGIMMLDIDKFGFLNESFGQEVGDQLLQELARLLHTSVREADIACRSGGGEFTLILPGGSLEIALLRAQQLREAVKQLTITHRGQTYGRVTVSIGVAAYPESGHTEEGVLRAVEAALHQAKREGRDRVVVAR